MMDKEFVMHLREAASDFASLEGNIAIKNFGDIFSIVAEKTGTTRSFVKSLSLYHFSCSDILNKTPEELIDSLVAITRGEEIYERS